MDTVKFYILIANSALIAVLFVGLIILAVLVLIALIMLRQVRNANLPPPNVESELELGPPPGDGTVGALGDVDQAAAPVDPVKLSKARATARERRLSQREARRGGELLFISI
jgi:hypothetical protein